MNNKYTLSSHRQTPVIDLEYDGNVRGHQEYSAHHVGSHYLKRPEEPQKWDDDAFFREAMCAILVFFVMTMGAFAVMMHFVNKIERHKDNSAYETWSRIHGDYTMTFEEWRNLRSAKALPND